MAHLDCSFYSQTLKKNTRVIVFLPSLSADDFLSGHHVDYTRKGAKFQTLYLLHGSYGDCTDWSHLSNIERYAQEKCLAVVMPSGENSSYVNMARGEHYLDYIAWELPDFLSKLFPLSRKKENTFIAGLSMGGYGAFRLALEYPDAYAFAASLSGALDRAALQESKDAHIAKMPLNYRKAVFADLGRVHGSENDLHVILDRRVSEKAALPKFYMTCGTEDFIYPCNVEFYEALAKHSVDVTLQKHHGTHCWDFWDLHIQDVLNWLPLMHDVVD
ncbi:alpha/beta hydrolase [Caproicibacter sp.]|uniref:alpha/beta hydrolase n=1 Tax=Caproicibacter sp. TaxID=2814884 RepID=UPI0039895629